MSNVNITEEYRQVKYYIYTCPICYKQFEAVSVARLQHNIKQHLEVRHNKSQTQTQPQTD